MGSRSRAHELTFRSVGQSSAELASKCLPCSKKRNFHMMHRSRPLLLNAASLPEAPPLSTSRKRSIDPWPVTDRSKTAWAKQRKPTARQCLEEPCNSSCFPEDISNGRYTNRYGNALHQNRVVVLLVARSDEALHPVSPRLPLSPWSFVPSNHHSSPSTSGGKCL